MWQYAAALWRRLAARLTGRPGRGPVERRHSLRYPSAARTTYRQAVAADAEALPATVRNISFGGINLVVREQFAPGTLLHIDLPGRGPAAPRFLACVAHVSPTADRAWSVGCSFIRELSEPELRGLM
jgi:hypothetical protein